MMRSSELHDHAEDILAPKCTKCAPHEQSTKSPRCKIPAFIMIFGHLLDKILDGQIKSKGKVNSSLTRRSSSRLIMPNGHNAINDRCLCHL
jgi:hypothetical protein